MPLIHFDYKNDNISNPTSDAELRAWFTLLVNNPTYTIEIDGYVDRKEGRKYFRAMLSGGRAQECRKYFLSQNIDVTRMRINSMGAVNPVMSAKAIRGIKGRAAKTAARLLNCRAEIKVFTTFYAPVTEMKIKGLVTDMNTGEPLKAALVKIEGSDGTKAIEVTDSSGHYTLDVKKYYRLAEFTVTAEANGYNPIDIDEEFNITPATHDMEVYTHHFRLEKNGYTRERFFSPIIFDSGSAALTPVAIDTLKRLIAYMHKNPEVVMNFTGDADWHEADFVNLAKLRAQSCVNYLAAHGIDKGRFIIVCKPSEKGFILDKSSVTPLIMQKESKQRFNPKRCTVVFWPARWDYGVNQ